MIRPMWRLCLFLCVTLAAAACDRPPDAGASTPGGVLRLAVTTSTRDSGLLNVLIPDFETTHSARVDVIAVGTGKALKLGENGDVDVLFVHARESELAFMDKGHGVRHEEVMYNRFELLGPPADPAGIRAKPVLDALRTIAAGGHRFISRGDDSGTHKREQKLWQKAASSPDWDEYLESGSGMGATLIMADQRQAYVLTDNGTFLASKDKIQLQPMNTTGDDLRNPYGVIAVNPTKHARINAPLAAAFIDYLISPNTQQLIGDFKLAGQPLFHPLRLPDTN